MGNHVWYEEVHDDQRMSYTVRPKDGALLRAKMLGGQLQALADIMTAMGDESGLHFETFIAEISTLKDGAIVFDLVVLPRLDHDQDPTPTASQCPPATPDEQHERLKPYRRSSST